MYCKMQEDYGTIVHIHVHFYHTSLVSPCSCKIVLPNGMMDNSSSALSGASKWEKSGAPGTFLVGEGRVHWAHWGGLA